MTTPTPINVFAPTKPHDKQRLVLDDPSRFKLLRAGRKFRKTSLGISWLAMRALTTGLTCPYVAPNRLQAKNIAWKDHVLRLVDELKSKKVPFKVNETELTITFPNNGRIQLLGVENKDTLRGISNWGAIFCDEYDDWEEDIWGLIIRPNLMTHQAPAIIAGTPKGMRGMWRLSQLQQDLGDGTFQPLFKEFHFTSHDNPDLPEEELLALEAEYKAMGEDYYQQEIMAEYVKPVGLVYKEWDTTHYMPFEYDPSLPIHISFDWGINDPTSVIWFQPSGSELRVLDYYEASDANIEHFVSVIRSKPYKPAELYTGDPAGKARTLTTGTSVIEMLAQRGIFVRTLELPPGERILTQVRVTHTFIPRLYVNSNNCERFRDCLLNYRYPQKRENAFNQKNEIPIHDQFSHAMRSFEYYCVNVNDVNNVYNPDNEIDLPQHRPVFGKTGY
jgi:phage terminase large subunit